MSKPPREFVPRTIAGRVVLFIASLIAFILGLPYLRLLWLINQRIYPYQENRPVDWGEFVFCCSLLGTGALGILWSLATPKWVAGWPCRIASHVALYVCLFITLGVLAIRLLNWWYP